VRHRFEQINEGIIAGADVLDSLTHLHVTRMYTWEMKRDHTAKRMANAVNMAFAGGNACEYSIRNLGHLLDAFRRTNPIAPLRAEFSDSVCKTDTTVFRDFMILPSPPRKSLNARACS